MPNSHTYNYIISRTATTKQTNYFRNSEWLNGVDLIWILIISVSTKGRIPSFNILCVTFVCCLSWIEWHCLSNLLVKFKWIGGKINSIKMMTLPHNRDNDSMCDLNPSVNRFYQTTLSRCWRDILFFFRWIIQNCASVHFYVIVPWLSSHSLAIAWNTRTSCSNNFVFVKTKTKKNKNSRTCTSVCLCICTRRVLYK